MDVPRELADTLNAVEGFLGFPPHHWSKQSILDTFKHTEDGEEHFFTSTLKEAIGLDTVTTETMEFLTALQQAGIISTEVFAKDSTLYLTITAVDIDHAD